MEVEIRKNQQGRFVVDIPENPAQVVNDFKKEVKAGYKSTEFWVAIAGKVIGILAITGVISPEQADPLTQAVVQLGGVAAVIASVFGYNISRGNAKK